MKKKNYTSLFIMMAFCAAMLMALPMGRTAENPDSLKAVLHSGANDLEKLGALTGLAEHFMEEEVYDSANACCDRAIELAAAIGDPGREAELNIIKGKALFYSKGPEPGLVYYRAGYQLFALAGDSAGMASALNGMGVMYQKLGRNDSALTCYIQLATIADMKGYEQILGMGYVNMGILYQLKQDYDKAIFYLDQSIALNKKYRTDLVALALMNKGLIYDDQDRPDSSLIKYREALSIYQRLGNNKMRADLYNNIGGLYHKLENLDSARHYYIKSKEIYVELGDWYTFSQVYYNLATIYIDLGNNDRALAMLDSCMATARETGNIDLMSLAYQSRYVAYSNKGNFRRALKNYRLHDSLDQVIYNMNKEKLMAELEMKYQNEKKQAQILILERDNLIKSKQNNIYLFSGIGIIALISFAFLYFRQRVRKDRIIAQQRIRQLEEEKKLLAAKALVEGQEEERKRIAREIHDGLGVLLSATRMQFSSISDASPETRPLIEKASKMLEQAANDARKISHNMMPGLLTKLGLYEAVGDLFEQLGRMEDLQVHAEIKEDLKRLSENREIMVYRIIQELVNNTLKHARAKTITLRMQSHADQLSIHYADDGIGFSLEENTKVKSIGLNSMRSRINFLKGDMEIDSEPGKGASFRIQVPY